MSRPIAFPLLILLVIFSPLAIDIFLPAVPEMATLLNTQVAKVQACIPIFLLAMGLGQLLSGPLADRFGRRPLALAGISLYILGSLLGAWADHIEILWLARLLQGFGACAVTVTAMAGVRDTYPVERTGTMYSYINGVICVIPALAPLLGGLLIEQWDWRATFYFMAIYALLALAVIAWRLPETRPADTKTDGALLSWERYQPIVSHPVFRYQIGFITLSMAVIIGYVSISPVQLMITLEQSPLAFSLWFGANAAMNIGCAFAAPSVIKRLGRTNGLKLSVSLCLLAGIGLLAFQQVHHPLAFMVPVFIASMGFCGMLAICCGAALAPFGERAGTASALMGLFQMCGASILVGLVTVLPLNNNVALAILMLLPTLWLTLCRLNQQNYRYVMAELTKSH